MGVSQMLLMGVSQMQKTIPKRKMAAKTKVFCHFFDTQYKYEYSVKLFVDQELQKLCKLQIVCFTVKN